jgi:hypothetical protein
MPAKFSLYREKESCVQFLLDNPNYTRHKEVTCTVNLEIFTPKISRQLLADECNYGNYHRWLLCYDYYLSLLLRFCILMAMTVKDYNTV